jgi:hypothetical protein
VMRRIGDENNCRIVEEAIMFAATKLQEEISEIRHVIGFDHPKTGAT